MSIFRKLKPIFWDQDLKAGPIKSHFNFRRIWKMAVLMTAGVTLVPLISMALIDFRLTQKSFESETLLSLNRLVSNTRRTVSSYLGEMKSALETIDSNQTYEKLTDSEHLTSLLNHLRTEFREFIDLGVFDSQGKLLSRVGSNEDLPENAGEENWFQSIKAPGRYTIDTFFSKEGTIRLGVSVKRVFPDGGHYLLRATVNADRFQELLASLDLSPGGDAFIIDQDGVLQTHSRSHGKILEKAVLPISTFSNETEVLEVGGQSDRPLIIGYGHVSEFPLILIIVQPKTEVMRSWYDAHMKMIGFLVASILIILLVILGVANYLVDMIYKADQERAMIQHEAEHTNRMASIGRLAAGVAHEINNPLAVINEKAGLLKDLCTFMEEYKGDERLITQLSHIISSVERCSFITQRLLRFARHIDDFRVQKVSLKNVITDTLEFLHKEAEYRCIEVDVDLEDDLIIETDRGKLQQIILNLANNSFAAMSDSGHFEIIARRNENNVIIEVTDNGSGISKADMKRIYEPFFSTKKTKGGTGLGLSITYGLVQELNGDLKVKSGLGKGTTFHIKLPIQKSEE
jgi:two-component system, NtrC family, sensor kinase